MHYQKDRAAKLLAVGDTVEEVAKVVGRKPSTVKLWMLEPEFNDVIFKNIAGAALKIVVDYMAGKKDVDKDRVRVALTLIKLSKSPGKVERPAGKADADDDDLGEFSEAALKRMGGE